MINSRTTYDRRVAAELLRGHDTFGTTILAILLQAYGTEVLDADPLEIYARVSEDFNATMSEECENRMNAMFMCVTTDLFYTDPEVFRAVCTCLYDGDLGDLVDGLVEDVTVAEMLWAIYEVGLFHDEPIPLSRAVQGVVSAEIGQEAMDGEDFGYEEFVEEAKQDLARQLESLKVSVDALGRLLPPAG